MAMNASKITKRNNENINCKLPDVYRNHGKASWEFHKNGLVRYPAHKHCLYEKYNGFHIK